MNRKITIGGRGPFISLTDKNYRAAGGEASIYTNGGMAYKIYHDEKKTLPPQKISELSQIKNPAVIIPEEVIFDASTSAPIGYTTRFIDNAEPILKLFTRTFKDQNNIDHQMVADLIKQMQLVTMDIHKAQCLVVDYNELNLLVKVGTHDLNAFYIDTDSYATPSFKATAIMDSVRDRRVSKNQGGHLAYNPDILSDWFSWGILAFWLYSNIHPFRGSHPQYRPKDKNKQMDDGISVFHRGVRVPPSVNDFKIIPQRHFAWFKDTFEDNHRSIPPLPDSSIPIVVPTQIVIIQGNAQIDVRQVANYSGVITSLYKLFGVNYAVTKTQVYMNGTLVMPTDKVKKTVLCSASDGTAIAATLAASKVTFSELVRNKPVDTIASTDMFVRNDAIYTMANGKLVENTFTAFNGGKIVHRITELENVSLYSATMFEGCVIQDLLGKKYLTLPYAKGRCFSKNLPQLDGHRIIEAKSDKTVTVILTEKGGKYFRFVVVFTRDFSSFNVREVADVAYDAINFAVMDNGVCLLLASPTELELFVSNQNIEVLNDPPFDSTMKLFSTPDGIFFVNGNSVHQIKKK
jgi:hypothetical protein